MGCCAFCPATATVQDVCLDHATLCKQCKMVPASPNYDSLCADCQQENLEQELNKVDETYECHLTSKEVKWLMENSPYLDFFDGLN